MALVLGLHHLTLLKNLLINEATLINYLCNLHTHIVDIYIYMLDEGEHFMSFRSYETSFLELGFCMFVFLGG